MLGFQQSTDVSSITSPGHIQCGVPTGYTEYLMCIRRGKTSNWVYSTNTSVKSEAEMCERDIYIYDLPAISILHAF